MTAPIERRFEFLRGNKSSREVVNTRAGEAGITLLELNGVEYHSSKDAVPKKKIGFSRRLRLMGGKEAPHLAREGNDEMETAALLAGKDSAQSSDAGHDSEPLATSPSLAKAVIWCHENEPTSSCKSVPRHLPGSMIEESIDDEGTILSWHCEWPCEANSFNIHLPLDHKNKDNRVISLSLGVQLAGKNEIQPLGLATVAVPEPEQSAAYEGVMDLVIPIDPHKRMRTMPSILGRPRQVHRFSCNIAESQATGGLGKVSVASRI